MNYQQILPWLPIVAALVAVTGALLVAWLNNRWAERPRKLDLYKIVYPEKLKAARELTLAVGNLYNKTTKNWHEGRICDQEVVRELRADTDALYAASIANEWLLGKRVADITRVLTSCMRKLVPETPRPGGDAVWDPLAPNDVSVIFQSQYQDLQREIRAQLHLDALDNLLPGIAPFTDGDRTSLTTVAGPSKRYVVTPFVEGEAAATSGLGAVQKDCTHS